MSLQGCLFARPVLQGNNRPLIKHFVELLIHLGSHGSQFEDGGSDMSCASEGEHISLGFFIFYFVGAIRKMKTRW